MNVKYLRPLEFPIEPGTPIANLITGFNNKFVAGPDAHGKIVIDYGDGVFQVYMASNYAQVPLVYVDGKPVYKGDVLYHRGYGDEKTIESFDGTYLIDTESAGWYQTSLTWVKPKVKKAGWFNLYKSASGRVEFGICYPTKETALHERDTMVRHLDTKLIEWEE